MSDSQIAIRLASRSDLRMIERTLGRAFHDDPVWGYVIGDKRGMAERVAVFIGIVARVHLANNSVWITEDGASVAIWAPPKKWRISARQFMPHALRVTRAAGLDGWKRLGALGVVEKRHPTEAHWYLAVLGTDPDHWGKGLGSALLEPVLARCDENGIGAYLESSKEKNVPFYERHGFRVTDSFSLPGGGPTLWSMWRDPQPPSSAP